MDFRAELSSLLRQIPGDRVARLGDVAHALGDVRASAAVARVLRENPSMEGSDRILFGRIDSSDQDFPFFRAFQGRRPLGALRRTQRRLAVQVSRQDGFRRLRTIAGVDLSYEGDRGYAALVVLRAKDLAVVEEVLVAREVAFPYIPTYLAFREFPLIEAAFRRLSEPPTVLMVDGHGQLHPLRCGIASFTGVRLNVPTIGVAKNPLLRTTNRRPRVGEAVPLREKAEILGYALRTSAAILPVYVSTGHRVSPRTAVRIVRRVSVHRQPEPLRLAHNRATEWKRSQRKKL